MTKRKTKGIKNRKRSKKSEAKKSLKLTALIISAIQDLREAKGTTPKKISEYINYASALPEGRVKRQVKAALKRGVEYGVLRRYRGQYFLPSGDEMDRANKMALRFSQLPSSPSEKMLAEPNKSSDEAPDWDDINEESDFE